MKKYYFFLLVLIISLQAYSQKGLKIPLNHRVILNYPEYIVYANILTTENKIKPSEDLYYYWFNSNDIKRTRGGFDGKILHGPYSSFYLNKNLREKGEFKYGVKRGKWKSWYLNGEFKEITNWKKGRQKGSFQQFDEKGLLVKKGNYKNDVYHGKIYAYITRDSIETLKYKHGKLILKKTKIKRSKEKIEDKKMDGVILPGNSPGSKADTLENSNKFKKLFRSKKETENKPKKKEKKDDVKIRRYFKVVPLNKPDKTKET